MNYRQITPDDMSSIFDVRVRTWGNDNGKEEMERLGITPSSVIEMMQKTHRGWLCEVDNRVVGFAMGNNATAEMWVIAVLPEFEGQGIGKELLSRVEQWLAEQGHQETWLTTYPTEGTRAIGFYQHLGWQRWKIEDEDLYMKKQLKSLK